MRMHACKACELLTSLVQARKVLTFEEQCLVSRVSSTALSCGCAVQAAKIKASLEFERQSAGRNTAEAAQKDLAAAQKTLGDLESEQEATEEAAQQAASELQEQVLL